MLAVGKSGTGIYDSANTRSHVVFALDIVTAYDFTVTSLETNGCCTWAPGGSVTLNRVYPSSQSLVLQPIYSVTLGRDTIPGSGNGFPSFSAQGTLVPGTYTMDYSLGVTASHNASAPGATSFDLVMTPEPNTGLLAMVGGRARDDSANR